LTVGYNGLVLRKITGFELDQIAFGNVLKISATYGMFSQGEGLRGGLKNSLTFSAYQRVY
jgi:hypothetical protein